MKAERLETDEQTQEVLDTWTTLPKRKKVVVETTDPAGRGRLLGVVPDGRYVVDFGKSAWLVPADGIATQQCTKCGGTGFYCQGTIDGQPYSNTGFDCWKCNGTGWQLKR